jgi:hypothetical protein
MPMNLIIGVLGLGLVCFGCYQIFKRDKKDKMIRARKTWPFVTAKVTGTKVKVSTTVNKEFFIPLVTFSYSVTGVEFTSEAEVGFSYSREDANDALKQWSIGNDITVHYDPQKPAEHITEYDTESYSITFFILLALIIGGIWAIYMAFNG